MVRIVRIDDPLDLGALGHWRNIILVKADPDTQSVDFLAWEHGGWVIPEISQRTRILCVVGLLSAFIRFRTSEPARGLGTIASSPT